MYMCVDTSPPNRMQIAVSLYVTHILISTDFHTEVLDLTVARHSWIRPLQQGIRGYDHCSKAFVDTTTVARHSWIGPLQQLVAST